MRRLRWVGLGLAVVLGLGGCATTGYYLHLAAGQIDLLRARQPISRLIASPDTDPVLKARLQRVLDARSWAVGALALPDNGSYTQYADLHRPYVVWNVFATPRYSLRPVEHCFLFVGCLAYQGFYTREQAQARADELAAQGFDAYVGGVPAYSTLGWFDDPVTNTMMGWNDAQLIGTLFHELAHQRLFARNDTEFNESYAQFVEQEGLRQYLAVEPLPHDAAAHGRRTQFVRLMLDARERLTALYAQQMPEAERAVRKREAFDRLRADYAQLRDTAWNGFAGYDAWFADGELNNAKLLPFGLYDAWVPAFATLFEREGRDWPRFHAAAQRVSKLPPAQRKQEMQRLLPAPDS